MTKKEKRDHILARLDELYGTEKEGFYHNADWQLLVAIMLSAQSTDKQVDEVLPGLFGRFHTAQDVAEADIEEIESYIRSVGLYKNKARNMKKCCEQIWKEYGGKVPDTLDEVLKLAGVGRKTANVVYSVAMGGDAIAVDTHVFRVSNRIGLAHAKDVLNTEKQLMAILPQKDWSRTHHYLIYLGRNVCKAGKGANCGACPVYEYCERNL